MSADKKIPMDGGKALGQNPFSRLSAEKLPPGQPVTEPIRSSISAIRNQPRNRGRVDIVRETAGRGGKTVTVAQGFTGIGQTEKEQLAKRMQKACGSGGTV